MRRVLALAAVVSGALWLAGCATGPADGPGEPIEDAASLPDAEPRDVPLSPYGNPESYVVFGERYHVMDSADEFSQRGRASWYGRKFHGRRTSSGEPYDMYAMTAAHKRLPLPSWVEVTNLANGRTAVVKVNDRGPFVAGRILDLSYAAASKLGVVATGTAPVEVRVVRPPRLPATDTAVAVADRESATASASGAASTVAAAGAPAAGDEPEAGEKAEPTATAAVDYYVQVGAFSSQRNAERMVGSLREASLSVPVRIQSVTRDGRSFYRVQLGPMSDAQAADRLGSRLHAQGLVSGGVITARE